MRHFGNPSKGHFMSMFPADSVNLHTAAPIPAAETRPAVLITDDDDLARAYFSSALDRAGYRVLVASNGGEALALLESATIAALLLDVFMPERDGLETLLIARRISPKTRIVVMSGRSGSFDYLDAALKLGADAVIHKPATPSELLSVLSRLDLARANLPNERRRAPRLKTDLEGQIFNPVDWQSTPCRVLNLSEGGALIACAGHALPDQPLVLYVANFGRFEATVAHRSEHLAGLQFKTGEAKLNRLKETLKIYAEHGVVAVATMRKYPRVKTAGKILMVRESGREISCDVLDISPDGVSLKTAVRPPVGEIVRVGKTRGRIVRHHDDGVALQFLR
jgi:CheY-like chemotaxis protein